MLEQNYLDNEQTVFDEMTEAVVLLIKTTAFLILIRRLKRFSEFRRMWKSHRFNRFRP